MTLPTYKTFRRGVGGFSLPWGIERQPIVEGKGNENRGEILFVIGWSGQFVVPVRLVLWLDIVAASHWSVPPVFPPFWNSSGCFPIYIPPVIMSRDLNPLLPPTSLFLLLRPGSRCSILFSGLPFGVFWMINNLPSL